MCDIYSEAGKRAIMGGFVQGRNFVNPKYFFLSLSRVNSSSLFFFFFSLSQSALLALEV